MVKFRLFFLYMHNTHVYLHIQRERERGKPYLSFTSRWRQLFFIGSSKAVHDNSALTQHHSIDICNTYTDTVIQFFCLEWQGLSACLLLVHHMACMLVDMMGVHSHFFVNKTEQVREDQFLVLLVVRFLVSRLSMEATEIQQAFICLRLCLLSP